MRFASLSVAAIVLSSCTNGVMAAPAARARELADYEENCASWNRDWENKEVKILDEALAAGREPVLLMNAAYFLSGDESWSDADVQTLNARLSNVTTSRSNEGSGAFGFTAKLNGQLVLSIAGTKDLEDAKADARLSVASKIDLGGKMYSAGAGAVDYWEKIRAALGHVLASELSEPGTPVLIVGHSLGGAVANLAAVDLANRYQARVRLVTAGSPRVFDSWNKGEGTLENSARSVQTELIVDGVGTEAAQNGYCEQPPSAAGKICTQRWVNFGDFVTSVPGCQLGSIGAAFYHIGNGGLLLNALTCLVPFASGNPVTAKAQHQDYTAYNTGPTNHGVRSYFDRMGYAINGLTKGGTAPSCSLL